MKPFICYIVEIIRGKYYSMESNLYKCYTKIQVFIFLCKSHLLIAVKYNHTKLTFNIHTMMVCRNPA